MILIINCGSSKTPYISDIITNLHFKNKVVPLNKFIPKIDLNNISGLIISGAPILVTEVDTTPYIQLFSFLKEIEIPVLGICFGHQILGMVYGAEPSKCQEDRNWQTIEIMAPSILFASTTNPVKMMEDHCEQITTPKDFKTIASSPVCNNEAMQHHTKNIFGIQFHPEVSENQGIKLMQNFCNLCQ